MSSKVATYQGRLDLDEVQSEFFDGYARHYSHVERCLHILGARLGQIERQIESGDPSICFGSRKLFRAQFELA